MCGQQKGPVIAGITEERMSPTTPGFSGHSKEASHSNRTKIKKKEEKKTEG
jgi:hypothetical protein